MIEINVRPAGVGFTARIVEASTEGAGFTGQDFCGPVPELRRSAREHAAYVARIFANGCRYAGAEVRMTRERRVAFRPAVAARRSLARRATPIRRNQRATGPVLGRGRTTN